MDYKELNDNELIYLCHDNNEEAINLVINKYKNCIITILKEYLKLLANPYDNHNQLL